MSVPIEDILKEKAEHPGISLSYAEELCVHRKIALSMIDHDVLLMHAAVIDVDGRGVAFAAKSGTGKPTRVRMWQKAMGTRVKVVNGDKPFLRFIGGKLYAYGTPWVGKERWGENIHVPLNYVCFLERAEDVELTRLAAFNVLPRLLNQVLMPSEEDRIDRFMSLLERFVQKVPFYLLKCNMDKEDPVAIWEKIRSDGD